MTIEPVTQETFPAFVSLIEALAEYEHLEKPDNAAINRLRRDAFSVLPRFWAWLAIENEEAVGYAIAFETYSSFLAKPTMYLEDVFVLESARGTGAGSALFNTVLELARERECGRMEWAVLDWNQTAIDFYKKKGAEVRKEWLLCRLTP
ncbi:MAG: GNAT family N-acetyltransferase [Bradyrhizobiaceae bacterium]|nr:GNAT family N-acetyltransferase [Bradyrhizobiaceae bacterium]